MFAFLHSEVRNTPLSAFLFLMLIVYLHNLWKFCTANDFDATKNPSCSSVTAVMARPKTCSYG